MHSVISMNKKEILDTALTEFSEVKKIDSLSFYVAIV